MFVATWNGDNLSTTEVCITDYTSKYNNTASYNYKPTDRLFIIDNYLVIIETEWQNNLVVLSISDKHKHSLIEDIKSIYNRLLTMTDHVLIQNSPKWMHTIKHLTNNYKQISDDSMLVWR